MYLFYTRLVCYGFYLLHTVKLHALCAIYRYSVCCSIFSVADLMPEAAVLQRCMVDDAQSVVWIVSRSVRVVLSAESSAVLKTDGSAHGW